MEKLTTDLLLNAYSQGYFPMAEDAESDEIYWFSPEQRGVMPLDGFHIPHGSKKLLKRYRQTLKVDTDFEGVMRACAEPVPGGEREKTWINEEIIALYCELHRQGHAHSVEVWEDNCHPALVAGSPSSGSKREGPPSSDGVTKPRLVGGLYGVSLGGAFFGESMFSRISGASKIALTYLVALLKEAGYSLLDTQYLNPHLEQFGGVEIPKVTYLSSLEKALSISPNPSSRFCTTAESNNADALVKSMLTEAS